MKDLDGIVLDFDLPIDMDVFHSYRDHILVYLIENNLIQKNNPESPRRIAYMAAASVLLANLIHASRSMEPLKIGMRDDFFADAPAGKDIFDNLLSEFEAAGWIVRKPGVYNPYSKEGEYTSFEITESFRRYLAKPRLIVEPALSIDQIKFKPTHRQNAPLTVLRLKDDDNEKYDAKFQPNEITKRTGEILSLMNRVLRDAVFTLDGDDFPPPRLQRKFSLDFQSHGRIYPISNSYQTLPEGVRERLFINGEPVVEKDFRCTHPTLAYGLKGLKLPMDDAYDLPLLRGMGEKDTMRNLAKRAVNVMFNVKSPHAAVEAIQNAITLDNEKALRRGLLDRLIPESFIDEDFLRLKLIPHILDYHSQIAEFLANGKDKGLRLMWFDSEIAMGVLEDFARRAIPVLPVHDSFIVQEQYGADLITSMKSNWVKVLKAHNASMNVYEPEIP